MKKIHLQTSSEDAGKRLDVYLAEKLQDKTRSQLQHVLAADHVLVGDETVGKKYKIVGNESVFIFLEETDVNVIEPENIPLTIVFEDEHLLVVNKDKGMVVHPGSGHSTGTLAHALRYRYGDHLSDLNGPLRPGIIHRIDKDTSGLLLIAKTNQAHENLAAQIKAHTARRVYEGIVIGNLKEDNFTIDKPIGRHPMDRKKMSVVSRNPKEAITHVQVLARYEGYTHARFILETGRTHQIRVHLMSIGKPILGDPIYLLGKKTKQAESGQYLHAKELVFLHPITNEEMHFEIDLPPYFSDMLENLKKRS